MLGNFAKTTLAVSVSLACGAAAQAAYLGQLKVQSAPAQNFVATVQVHDVDATAKSLLAKLAPVATYDRYQLTMPQSAQGLTMALVSKNPLTLKVSGKRPAQETAFPLLLELHEGDQVTVRQYNIRLGATGSVEPVAPTVKTQAVAVAPVKAEVKAQPVVQKVETKPAKEMTPLERMRAKNYDLSKPITIEEGYTPWSLGTLYQSRYPNASIPQVLVALAVHNAEAFPSGNVRQLKTGAKVVAPPASLVQSINRQTAHEIVQKGLKIEEVAKRPMPIVEEPVVAKKPEKKAQAKPTVKSVSKPAASVTPPVEKPQTAVAPVEAAPKVEPVEAKPTEVVQPEPTPAPADNATVATPEAAAPATETVVEEPAPTLEIMTEEEVVQEEESSSWYWWLLLVVLLGAGGYVFWRTKQGKKVDFESLKKAMQEKGKPRQEPVISRPMASTVVTSATAVEVKPQEPAQAVREPEVVVPRQAPKVEPIPTVKVAAVPPKASEDDTFNVFDLVSEEPPLPNKVEPKPATPVARPNVVQSVKVEQSMNDTLEMARSFIAINSQKEAVMLLQEVLQNGTSEERQTAQVLLDQIRQQS